MHPRNRHAGRYDLEALVKSVPDLASFVRPNPSGQPTVDFADPAAVEALNRALLKVFYGVERWSVPPGYLCPPVPGRADYVHCAADLLASVNEGVIPRGDAVRALDVGVGANCIYPLIGRAEYGWRFLGSEIDAEALANAREIVAANGSPSGAVELRLQKAPAILAGLVGPEERFDLTLCNPPFGASLAETEADSRRKWRNLGRPEAGRNFGGRGGELWTPGGEAAFARRLVAESAPLGRRILWFTTLISKSANLPGVLKALERAAPSETRVVEMAQGQKRSRLVAWTFLDAEARRAWRRRWQALG